MADKKIIIKSLYKIFGKNPGVALEHVKQGVEKDELLEKHNHVLGLSNIDLDIFSHSIQVIMGLSGSGKSTLIRHINRLIEPTVGKIIVEDQEITNLNTDQLRDFRRKKTAMVFQRFALLPHKTVLQNVSFGLDIQKRDPIESKSKAMKWIERVGLNGYETKYPQHLSGGMQQRVGLARALSNDADILLMDEAFSALDPLIRKNMQDILLELQSELKKTVIFITHDLDEALKLGDRIAILKDGKMDQEGEPIDILLNPKTSYVKEFVEDVNRGRVLKAKNIMETSEKINLKSVNGNSLKIQENLPIEMFINKVIKEKPEMIEVINTANDTVGYISAERLSTILEK
jgi:glycine betaine/proline transport system ATP-binding protein